jgi:hypothetical protein
LFIVQTEKLCVQIQGSHDKGRLENLSMMVGSLLAWIHSQYFEDSSATARNRQITGVNTPTALRKAKATLDTKQAPCASCTLAPPQPELDAPFLEVPRSQASRFE